VRGTRGRRVNTSPCLFRGGIRLGIMSHRTEAMVGRGAASRVGPQALDLVLLPSSRYPERQQPCQIAGGPDNTRSDGRVLVLQQTGRSLGLGDSISTSAKRKQTPHSTGEQDIDTALLDGSYLQPGPSLVVWLAWDGLGGNDQLVVAPTNQGHNGSPISTARHVPRPPQHHRNATCQTLRPASFSRSLRLCLSTAPGCGGVHAVESWLRGRHLEQTPPLRRIVSTSHLGVAASRCQVCLPSSCLWLFHEEMPEIVPSPYLPGATGHGHMLDWSVAPLPCGVNGIDLACMHDRIKDTGHTGELTPPVQLPQFKTCSRPSPPRLAPRPRASGPHPSGHERRCPVSPGAIYTGKTTSHPHTSFDGYETTPRHGRAARCRSHLLIIGPSRHPTAGLGVAQPGFRSFRS
jgi:hypothetical protein